MADAAADELAEAAMGVLNCMAQGHTATDDLVMDHDNGCLMILAAAIERYKRVVEAVHA